jgi:N-glycosylase/DNA lyase
MKQVAHIRQISKALRNRFGNICRIDPPTVRQRTDSSDRRNGFGAANNCPVHTFPQPLRIAEASVKELRECALGYRAKNLLATARLVAGGDVDLEQIADLSDVDLRIKLCELPGVGAKIANCVMLFAYDRLRAFPIDVWIERILRQKYFPRARKLNASRLQAFTKDYFGEYGGYAQQYLFHYARMSGNRSMSNGKRIRRHLSGH